MEDATLVMKTTMSNSPAAVIPCKTLRVMDLEPRLKHPTVFAHFDALQRGQAFEIINDHDPRPLYYQMIAERGAIFLWEYLEQGPDTWRVVIRKHQLHEGKTIGQIAASDSRKAEVFKKFGIDFCCGGKKNLQQVCKENGLDVAKVELALKNAPSTTTTPLNFNAWQPGFLADYIYNQHHQYYYTEEPEITGLVDKVCENYGNDQPGFKELKRVYYLLKNELDAHFKKEEVVVFPFIKNLELAKAVKGSLPVQPSLSEALQIMAADHEAAAEALRQIANITNNYKPDVEACNDTILLYKKLLELQEDLHQHIHLENNILFPKALVLEKEFNEMK